MALWDARLSALAAAWDARSGLRAAQLLGAARDDILRSGEAASAWFPTVARLSHSMTVAA